MERQSSERFNTARAMTAEFSDTQQYFPDASDIRSHPYVVALQEFNRAIPSTTSPWQFYGRQVLGAQPVMLGQRELPTDDEEAAALIEAIRGNIARITLLKGSRSLALGGSSGALSILCDSDSPGWEIKTTLTVTTAVEGRWASFYGKLLSIPFSPNYYSEIKPAKQWGWLGRRQRPELLDATRGDWVEMFDMGLRFCRAIQSHELGEPYYQAGDASLQAKQQMERYRQQQSRFFDGAHQACVNAASQIVSEAQRATHQLGAGPRNDFAGGFSF
ncbi:hypothetical protein [Botrimarina mediterranea]|uniref:hypothetical protein n=1 Tax=Botrimarina mediterranea TaxID=2528022 RepID=UPI0011A21590